MMNGRNQFAAVKTKAPFWRMWMMVSLVSLGLFAQSVSQAAVVYFMIDGSAANPTFGTNRWNVQYSDAMIIDGFDLFVAAFGAPVSLGGTSYRLGSASGNHAMMSNFGTDQEPNYILTSITMNGITLTSSSTPPLYSPTWSQWVEGGLYGYPDAESDPEEGAWDFGSGMSDPYRIMANGAFEAYMFGDYAPPVGAPSASAYASAPTVFVVPEPSRWMLLLAAGCVLVARRKRAVTL